jgi:uncharacterized phosphatase
MTDTPAVSVAGQLGQTRAAVATTVCLVRHGETDWNDAGKLQGREDTELNARGREQARCSAIFLREQKWDLIATSPLKRAAGTAAIVAEHLGIERVVELPELVERDYGAASGMTTAEMRVAFPDGDVPGLEERDALGARCMRGLRALVAEHEGKRIVVVAHGGVINAVLAALSDGEIGSGKTRLGNACISLLHFREAAWEIESHNVVSHLADRSVS